MSSFKTYIFSFIACLAISFVKAQGVPIGQWRDHLSYKQGKTVAEGGGKVYCLAGNGLFSYNKNDNSLSRMSTITGLSGSNFSTIAFNKFNNTLVICYADGNIDLIQSNRIINMPDIKRKGITGNTTINKVYFINQMAYLATGFGIVVLDTDRNEIKDTYYIAAGGAQINVNEVSSLGDTIFAATESGIFRASLSNPFLSNYANWSKYTSLPAGLYNAMVSYNNKVYTSHSRFQESGAWTEDTVYVYNSGSWSPMPQLQYGFVSDLSTNGFYLQVTSACCVNFYDTAGSYFGGISQFYGQNMAPRDVVTDADNVNWIADAYFGLIRWYGGSLASIYPSGPANPVAYAMDSYNGEVVSVPGSLTETYNNTFTRGTFSSFKDESWISHTSDDLPIIFTDTLWDMVSVAIDTAVPGKYYIGTWWKGLVEIQNGQVSNIYDHTNSSLIHVGQRTAVGGLAFDKNHNLWMSNNDTPYGLSVKSGSTWKNFNLGIHGVKAGEALTKVIATQNNIKWILAPRYGRIIFYDDNGTISNTGDDKVNSYKCAEINGITCTQIFSMAEDREGDVWVGTDKGIQVFYSSEDLFAPGVMPQQILIEQDGHTQVLLATEEVSAIAVDGANRKWIGTRNAGVFLLSADGTKQISHFDTDNSPIFSNQILDIVINQLNGEVFISTSAGLMSYRSTSTEGKEDFENVYAYPNPVQPGYEGSIAIKGLVTDADVKITDISGSLVYATKALGGQAVWNGKNFKNERVATGIYLVFCSNEDGSKTFITKILMLN